MIQNRQEDLGVKEFASVYCEELKSVVERRRNLDRSDPLPGDGLDDDQPHCSQTEEQLRTWALKRNLCGLALSGGGIRSATFCLGVLQGLAAAGLLKRIDYLSTVSGGGYIGAWLSAWIRRDGIDRVVEGLKPPAFREPLHPAISPTEPGANSREPEPVEPEAIRHLRLYSNYLAPRHGLLTFDGWTLIAIYLRNLLLNQLVLILAVFGLFAMVRLFVEFFALVYRYNLFVSPVVLCLAAIVPSVVAIVGVWLLSPEANGNRCPDGKCRLRNWSRGRAKQPEHGDGVQDLKECVEFAETWMLWKLCIIPLTFAAMATSLLLVYAAKSSESILPAAVVCTLVTTMFVVVGNLTVSSTWRSDRRVIVSALVVILATAVAFFPPAYVMLQIATSLRAPVAIISTFGVPLFLMSIVLGSFLMTGLRGYAHENERKRNDDDEANNAAPQPPRRCKLVKSPEIQREWWSQVAARLMMVSAGWAAVVGCVVFGPWAVVGLFRLAAGGIPSAIAGGTLGASWFAILAAGLRAAQQPATGSPNQRGVFPLLARATPPLFLGTLLLLCAVGGTWILYDFAAQLTPGEGRDFVSRSSHLLEDFNLVQLVPTPDSSLKGFPLGWLGLLATSFISFLCCWALGRTLGPNVFSLQRLYRNRLVRCYLGATNTNRSPEQLVNLDVRDDMPLASLSPEKGSKCNGTNVDARGPFHIINGALNQKASSVHHGRRSGAKSSGRTSSANDLAENLQFGERQSESFIFTPLNCGSQSTGYCPTHDFCGGIRIGEAIAVSGAAVSPNMGYHSSPSVTALLTVFNVRLGEWFPNPRTSGQESNKRKRPSPFLLLHELAGMTDSKSDYVYVSDGGHFENMGVYELIRRRCRFILAVDAGADPKFHENVGRVVRQVRIDFGVWIDVNMRPVTPGPDGLAESHVVVGRIHYGYVDKPETSERASPSGKPRPSGSDDQNDPRFLYEENQGIIIWLKNSLTGDEPGDVANQVATHPTFPYDTTLDQFFDEPQFESYRALGLHTVLKSLNLPAIPQADDSNDSKHPCQVGIEPVRSIASTARRSEPTNWTIRQMFELNYDYWLTKPGQLIPKYIHENEAYARIQNILRTESNVRRIADSLYGGSNAEQVKDSPPTTEERLMANEMFTLLENVWFSLDLEQNQYHPIHSGWMEVFRRWSKSQILHAAWQTGGPGSAGPLCCEYSPAFRRFINSIIRIPGAN